MPFSHSAQISTIVGYAERLQPASVLDVGAGMGQYGVLLRNHLEQAVVLEEHPAQTDTAWSKDGPEALAFQEARSRVLADFERQYLERLMAKHEGKVVAAAEEAGLSRVYLYRLLAKYRLLR